MEDRLKNQSRILLINDMAGYGKVALSVMIPVSSHMKYETFNLPTVLISNTLDYGNFDILDTTEYMQNTLRVWNELQTSCTKFEMKDIADRLHELGAKAVVITSANIDGKMFTVVKNSLHSEMTLIPYEEIPVRFPGTGDVFMAIVVGHYLRSGKLSESVQTAMHQLEKIIRSNINNTDKYKRIPIEQFLEDIQL